MGFMKWHRVSYWTISLDYAFGNECPHDHCVCIVFTRQNVRLKTVSHGMKEILACLFLLCPCWFHEVRWSYEEWCQNNYLEPTDIKITIFRGFMNCSLQFCLLRTKDLKDVQYKGNVRNSQSYHCKYYLHYLWSQIIKAVQLVLHLRLLIVRN